MKSKYLENLNIPDTPGVYMFLKKKLQASSFKLKAENLERILYIGKATSLRDRVKSYFSKDIGITRSLLIEDMVKEAETVDWIETGSVLEALILEANLIKKHKPKYNTKEKDDKSFNFVVITKEDFPRVFTVRGKELQHKYDTRNDFKKIFGPYPQGGSLREGLKIIRKIFPFRGEKDPVEKKKRASTINEEIGLVPRFRIGPSRQSNIDARGATKKDYQKTINNIRLFLEGKKSQVLKNLDREMKEASKKERFEKASEIKKQFSALKHINDVALMKDGFYKDGKGKGIRIEAYDIAHISETHRVGVLVSFRGDEADKRYYRKFKIRTAKKGDIAALSEIIERRLGHPEWLLPELIVLDGGIAQIKAVERVLKLYGVDIPILSVVKDDKHRAREVLGRKDLAQEFGVEAVRANAEAHRFAVKYHRERRMKDI